MGTDEGERSTERAQDAADRLTPEVLSGTPVFAGTRVPAQTLLEYLEGGRSLAEFLADFPTMTRAQAVAALEEAKDAWLARARVPAESVIDLLDSWLEEDSKREGESPALS